MKNNFDKIDESLEIKATITAKEIIKESKKEIRSIHSKDHSELDYDYIRGTLYNLIEKDKKQQQVFWNLLKMDNNQEHMKFLDS